MKKFMDEDFLLLSEPAKKLYHDYAENMPILDYHCHISPKEIAEDRHFDNITQVWLGGDHYKWRLMRAFGLDEKYMTGDASDKEKFLMFAKCLGRAVGNPLYHWGVEFYSKEQIQLQRRILNGEGTEAVVPEINNEQGPLMQMPIVSDPDNVDNYMARIFYGKEKVWAIPRDEWIEQYGEAYGVSQ